MPIYEYVCLKCGNILELLQKVDENEVDEQCLICGGTKFQKKISAANIGKNSNSEPKESLCCGRSERPTGCIPGSCCGAK
ncbi:MAG: zinc ribbon domain-containing protein [Firmicutes bacterium]|nr:zinc ribbon domain-containing protein [Bacillota bacterium]